MNASMLRTIRWTLPDGRPGGLFPRPGDRVQVLESGTSRIVMSGTLHSLYGVLDAREGKSMMVLEIL